MLKRPSHACSPFRPGFAVWNQTSIRLSTRILLFIPLPGTALMENLEGELLNVNTATAGQLAGFPHIGPTGARGILAYRRSHPISGITALASLLAWGDTRADLLWPYLRFDYEKPDRFSGQLQTRLTSIRLLSDDTRFLVRRTLSSDRLGAAFVIERHPGEANPLDFVTGHLEYRLSRALTIYVGDDRRKRCAPWNRDQGSFRVGKPDRDLRAIIEGCEHPERSRSPAVGG